MGKTKRSLPEASEQAVLNGLEVIALDDDTEVQRCDQLIVEHHYLHNATLYRGTAYTSSGWRHLGLTAGWTSRIGWSWPTRCTPVRRSPARSTSNKAATPF